jgi:hypothetical protein
MRQVIVATGILAVGLTPFAVAATGDALREGQRNGTTRAETEIISNIGSTTGLKGGYSTRQSNLSSTGGGAIYGCRSGAGGSAATPAQNPCVRANNLNNGLAFEFNATNGAVVGTIRASGNGGDAVKPFTTNATGVATGLNADRVDGFEAAQLVTLARTRAGLDADTVDGLDSTQLRTRFVLVNAAGQIERQSGGFAIAACYPEAPDAANGNCYINAGSDLTNKGIVSTIALQNMVNQGGGTMNGTNSNPPNDGDNLEFSGEISNSVCGLAGIVGCAPAGTNNTNHFVVSPRLSDGQRTDDTNRKRFYTIITE